MSRMFNMSNIPVSCFNVYNLINKSGGWRVRYKHNTNYRLHINFYRLYTGTNYVELFVHYINYIHHYSANSQYAVRTCMSQIKAAQLAALHTNAITPDPELMRCFSSRIGSSSDKVPAESRLCFCNSADKCNSLQRLQMIEPQDSGTIMTYSHHFVLVFSFVLFVLLL
jgi:hypothetical protein